MQLSDFQKGASGRALKHELGYVAFVPNPLPPELRLSMDWVRELSAADRALSELAGVGRTLPNPHLLIRPFASKEAVLSSRIEGTQASLSALLFFEAASGTAKAGSDVREVANYVTALEHGLARLSDLPVCLRLLREMHEKLMAGVRRSDRLLAYWNDCRARLHAERAGPLALRLVDDLFHWPALSVMRVAARFKATPAGIQRCVDRLVRAGILAEATGAKRNRIYLAQEIVGILEAP